MTAAMSAPAPADQQRRLARHTRIPAQQSIHQVMDAQVHSDTDAAHAVDRLRRHPGTGVGDDRAELGSLDQPLDIHLFDHGVDVDRLEDLIDVHPLDHLVEVDAIKYPPNVDPVDQRIQVDTAHHDIQIELAQKGLQIDLSQQRVEIDAIDQSLQVDLLQYCVEVDAIQHRLDVDSLQDLVDVDGAHHTGNHLVDYRLEEGSGVVADGANNSSAGSGRRGRRIDSHTGPNRGCPSCRRPHRSSAYRATFGRPAHHL